MLALSPWIHPSLCSHMFIPARSSCTPEWASYGAGHWAGGCDKHAALSACLHRACWRKGETDIKSLCKSLINTGWIPLLPQFRIIICSLLRRNKIPTPTHGLKGPAGSRHSATLSSSCNHSCSSPRLLAPQDCLLGLRPTPASPEPPAPPLMASLLLACSYWASRAAQHVCLPSGGLSRSPALSATLPEHLGLSGL